MWELSALDVQCFGMAMRRTRLSSLPWALGWELNAVKPINFKAVYIVRTPFMFSFELTVQSDNC